MNFGFSGPFPIECVGIDRLNRTFFVYIERTREDPAVVTLMAYVRPDALADEFFELRATGVDEGRLQVVTLNHQHDPRFQKVGLPEACIRLLGKTMSKPVVSSSNEHASGPDEYRTPAATQAWQRLVVSGDARYDAGEDRFHLLALRTPPRT